MKEMQEVLSSMRGIMGSNFIFFIFALNLLVWALVFYALGKDMEEKSPVIPKETITLWETWNRCC